MNSHLSRFMPNGRRRDRRYHTQSKKVVLQWEVKKSEGEEASQVGILKAKVDHPNMVGMVELEFKSDKTPTLDIACRKTAEDHVCTEMQKTSASMIFNKTNFHDKREVIQTMKNKNISLPALWSWMSKFRRDELYAINGAIHHKDAMWRVFKDLDEETKKNLIIESHLLQFELKDELFLIRSSLHATGKFATWAVWFENKISKIQSHDFGRLVDLIREHVKNDGLVKKDLEEMNLKIRELRGWFSENKEQIKMHFIRKIRLMMGGNLLDMEREMFDPMYAYTTSILYLKGQMPKAQDMPDFAYSLLPLHDQLVAIFAREGACDYFNDSLQFDELRPTISTNIRTWISENIQRGYRSARSESKDRFRLEDFYQTYRDTIKKMANESGLPVDTSTLDDMIKSIEYHGQTDIKTSNRVFQTTQEIIAVMGLRFNRSQSSERFDTPMQIDMNRADVIISNLKDAAKKIQAQKDQRQPRQSAKTLIWDRMGNKLEIELTGARLHDMPIGGYIANLEGKTYPLLWMENEFKAIPIN